ncbi:MAG: hypothetical protein OEW42_17420 [Acidimicrobiia bacterium]|nr:hypothetical protein [Acidimicrobiia bacterium]MDH5236146.1 hypothetical protein [Acidimicrobiia bacterium]
MRGFRRGRRRPDPPSSPSLHESWRRPRRFDPESWAVTLGTTTSLGTTGSGSQGVIDDRGTVQLSEAAWTLEWWVGAEDRWHCSGSEINIRQLRLGAGPVTEALMGVPGGDVVQRAAGAESDPAVVLLEFENRSAVPVALALVIRPFRLDGPGRVDAIALDGPAVRVDGEPALVLDRLPAAAVGGSAVLDLGPALEGCGTHEPDGFECSCPAGSATAAVIAPLAHQATIRVALGTADPSVFARLPTATQVGAGWAAHLDGGPRLDLPIDDEAFRADLATVLVAAAQVQRPPLGADRWTTAHQARVLEAVTRLGHPLATIEVPRWLETTDLRSDTAAVAMAISRATTDASPGWFDDYLGWAADSLHRGLERDDPDAARAVGWLSALLARTGQIESAAAVAAGWGPAPRPEWSCPGAIVDPVAAAGRLIDVVDQIVADRPDGLDLLPVVPAGWFGRSTDVRDLVTAHGSLSFAVRWHGERPALLWEVQPWEAGSSVLLRCPGLDPSWTSTDTSGEALLAAPAGAGAAMVEPGQSFG